MSPTPNPPHRPAYLVADLVTSGLLVAACTWALLRAVLFVHEMRPLSGLVLALLILIVCLFSASCVYYKLSYFRMAMQRSLTYWNHPDHKEQP